MRRSITYFDGLGRALQTRREAEDGLVIVENAVTFNARQRESEQLLPYYDTGLAYDASDLERGKTSLNYDAMGRIVRLVNPDQSFSSFVYFPLMTQQFDEEDNRSDSAFRNTPKTLTYDGLGRLICVEEMNVVNGMVETYTTSYKYDVLDNLIRIEDNQDNVTTMRYDGLSRKVYQNHPDSGEMTYQYDDNGNLVSTTDANNQRIRYTYDGANRLLQELWVYSEDDIQAYATFHYDFPSEQHPDARNTQGQISYIEDQVGAIYFSYDSRGNRAGEIRYFEEENVEFVTRMTYDATDRLTALVYPDGTSVEYKYNLQGLLDQIPNFVTDVNYTAANQRDSIVYGNGVRTSYSYDERLRLDHLHTTTEVETIQELTYEFDAVGNIVSITDGLPNGTDDSDQTQDYSYDALYRLTGVTGAFGQISYAYDSIGNLVEKTSSTGDPHLNLGSMHYGEGAGPHALTSVGNETRQYDRNGNLIDNGNASLTWDLRNQLRTVTDGTTVSTYTYNANGERSRQLVEDGHTIQRTLYINKYAEIRGNSLFLYVYDDTTRVAQFRQNYTSIELLGGFTELPSTSHHPDSIMWYVTDHLGGTNLLVDSGQQVVSEVLYYPYGTRRYARNSDEVIYQFSSKELDATGFQYFGARYYDPYASVWLSVDPLTSNVPTMTLENPQGLNTYLFALGNPVRYQDPDGLIPIETIWDAANVAIGIHSYQKNVQEGNYGAAAVDALGVIVDTLAVATPYVPGGASTAIKAARGVENVVEAAQGADNVHDITMASRLWWGTWGDYPKVVVNGQEYAQIGDRLYSHHAVNRMQPSGHRYGQRTITGEQTGGYPQITQPYGSAPGGLDYGRSVSPNYVEDVIASTPGVVQSNGNIAHRSGSLQVILSPEGRVVTIETF